MNVATHHLRCTECAAAITKDDVSSNFRCPQCSGLYEVVYAWSDVKHPPNAPDDPNSRLPNPSALRWLWQKRRSSSPPGDPPPVFPSLPPLPLATPPPQLSPLPQP